MRYLLIIACASLVCGCEDNPTCSYSTEREFKVEFSAYSRMPRGKVFAAIWEIESNKLYIEHLRVIDKTAEEEADEAYFKERDQRSRETAYENIEAIKKTLRKLVEILEPKETTIREGQVLELEFEDTSIIFD